MAAPLSVARAHPGVDSLNRRVQLASAAHSFGNCVRWTLVAFLVTSRLGLGALGVVSAAGLAGQGLGFLLAGPGIAVVGLRRLLAIGATTSALAQAVLLVCLGLHSPATALIVVNFAAGVALQCFGMAAKSSAVACAGPSGMAKAVAQASVAVNAGSYAGTFVGALVWAMFGDGVEFALAAVLVLPSLAGLEAARARHWEPLSDGLEMTGPQRVVAVASDSWRLLVLAGAIAAASSAPLMLFSGLISGSVGAVWVAPAAAIAALASMAVVSAARRLGDPKRVEAGLLSACVLGAGVGFVFPGRPLPLVGALGVATFCSVLASSRLEALVVGRTTTRRRPHAQSLVAASATFGSALGAWALPVVEAAAARSHVPHPSPLEAATLALGVGGVALLLAGRAADRWLRRMVLAWRSARA